MHLSAGCAMLHDEIVSPAGKFTLPRVLKALELHGFSYIGGPEDGSKQVHLLACYVMPHKYMCASS